MAVISLAVHLVDVFTVQLYEACEWRGWLEGYRDI
jgi:hypothetical protein